MKDDHIGSGPTAQTTQRQVGPMVLGRMQVTPRGGTNVRCRTLGTAGPDRPDSSSTW